MIRSTLLGMILLFSGAAQAAVDITANQTGRLTSVGNQFTRTFHEYDAQGRIVGTQYVQDGQSRTFTTAYDYPQNPQSTAGPGSVPVSQTFPDGERILYTHDASGAQVTVRSTLGASTQDILRDLRMNARGQVTQIVLGNSTVTTRSYNDDGDLNLALMSTVNALGQKVQEYGYAYDDNGNVTGTTDGVRPDQSATYTYDELDQLTSILNESGNVIEQYDYDAIGNLKQKGALIQTYGAGGRPHALATSGGVSYGYDANGNVVTVGGNTALEWNAENMSSRVTAGPVVTQKSFVGEARWKKVEDGVTTYYLPSMRLENGIARKYYGAFAERLEQPADRQLRFYHPDHLGSSSVMTDQSGSVIRRVSYFPFGQERGVEGTFIPKLQFNFMEKDASGFYDYGARLYNPVTGRWLSPDNSLADGPNRYAYVRNNPWTRIDPTGHKSERFWIECITCGGSHTRFSIWEGEIPAGWQRVSMPAGYQPIDEHGVIKLLLPDGTLHVQGKDGNWREGSTADLPRVSREEAIEAARQGGPGGEGEDLQAQQMRAIGNAMEPILPALALAYGGSVLIGAAAGAVASGVMASGVTAMWIEFAPIVQHSVTVVGNLTRTAAWAGKAVNTLRTPFYAYNQFVQRVWMEEVVRRGGPVIVDKLQLAGRFTKAEIQYFKEHGMAVFYIP